jgi:hypothetical protein
VPCAGQHLVDIHMLFDCCSATMIKSTSLVESVATAPGVGVTERPRIATCNIFRGPDRQISNAQDQKSRIPIFYALARKDASMTDILLGVRPLRLLL